jgi:hypothetical protein
MRYFVKMLICWPILVFGCVATLNASPACDESAGNISWNYENISPGDPHSAYQFLHSAGKDFNCAFGAYPCTEEVHPERIKAALEIFTQSMGTNQNAINKIEQCYTDIGAIELTKLFTVAGGPRPCNWPDAEVNLHWEGDNNIPDTQNAVYVLSHNTDGVYSDTGKKIQALAFLMDGQAHNPPVVHKYQGCYAEDSDRFFRLAAQYTHSLPSNFVPK